MSRREEEILSRPEKDGNQASGTLKNRQTKKMGVAFGKTRYFLKYAVSLKTLNHSEFCKTRIENT